MHSSCVHLIKDQCCLLNQTFMGPKWDIKATLCEQRCRNRGWAGREEEFASTARSMQLMPSTSSTPWSSKCFLRGFRYPRQLLRNHRVKRCADASAWQLHIWIYPVLPPKSLPQAPSAPFSYQSCIVLQTSVVMLSGFFLWSGPGHKTTVTWVIDPAMKMAILLCINMKAACGTGALSDSSLFLLRGKIHTQLMAVQREALLWDIK